MSAAPARSGAPDDGAGNAKPMFVGIPPIRIIGTRPKLARWPTDLIVPTIRSKRPHKATEQTVVPRSALSEVFRRNHNRAANVKTL